MVYVEWRDSRGLIDGIWFSDEAVEQLEQHSILMKSIGILIAEQSGARGHIVIASSYDGHGNFAHPIKIPRESVVKIKNLGVL